MLVTAHNIIKTLMPFRRMADHNRMQCSSSCDACWMPHITKILHSVNHEKPISFILPAFPGKSPNLSKVLGILPDMAERCSLIFLNNLCQSIEKIYAPGARIIICSDGRVFSDIVGMQDMDITAYQQALDSMIADLNLVHISTFNLDQLYSENDFDLMRKTLVEAMGEPVAMLQEKVRRGALKSGTREEKEAKRMYCGITRFLFEDALYPGQQKSRTDIQKDAKKRAYGVIQRSNAWSKLLATQFPDHVRLSIHPQTCGDVKLGITLLEGNWMTPWHGVALNRNGEITFVKRYEAEKLGATLIYKNGRPDHFQL